MIPPKTSLARVDQVADEVRNLLAVPSVPPDKLRAMLLVPAI
jgi:hypothetical protein